MRERVEQTVRGLLTDRMPALTAETLEPMDDDEDAIRPDEPPFPQGEAGVAMLISLLTEVFSLEDDYLGWTMLGEMLREDPPLEAAPIFLAALEAPSANIRAKALRYFDDHQVEEARPLLENLWNRGLPGWARTDLIYALARQGSSAHLDDFLAMTSDPDPTVRLAAIDALATFPGDAAFERLLDLSRSGSLWERGKALDGIASYVSSDKALEAILGAAREDDPIESRAVSLLPRFHRPRADERLLEYVRATSPKPWLKLLAAHGLADSESPGATEALLDLLTSPGIRGTGVHEIEVLEILRDRGDAAAAPRLRDMARSGGALASDYEKVAGYLSGDGSETPTWTVVHCGSDDIVLEDPYAFHVVAPRGRSSVRCSDGPGLPGASWLEERIPDGALVHIHSRFDRDETWAELGFSEPEGCWVPLRFLEPGPGREEWGVDPKAPELDLPADALEPRVVQRLIRKGAIEPFDPDEGVIAVVLHPRDEGPTLEDLFAALRTGTGIAAADVMEDILDDVEAAAEEEEADASIHSDQDEEEDD